MSYLGIVRAAGLGLAVSLAALGARAEGGDGTSEKAENGIETASLDFATPPPFGRVEKVCKIKRKAMGDKVETQGKYTIWDSKPGSAAARPFYLTGFSDNCPRRVTAALVMFGSLELYELVHFGGVGVSEEKAATHKAYKKLRAGCGKGACPERKIKSLSRSTAFISAYERQGGARNFELLVHKGKLRATAVK